jgi:hypothetical protein
MHRLDAEPVDECAGWELGESGLRSGPSAVAAAYSWSVQPPMGHEHAVGDESVVIADDHGRATTPESGSAATLCQSPGRRAVDDAPRALVWGASVVTFMRRN